jgi:hypothetical protein
MNDAGYVWGQTVTSDGPIMIGGQMKTLFRFVIASIQDILKKHMIASIRDARLERRLGHGRKTPRVDRWAPMALVGLAFTLVGCNGVLGIGHWDEPESDAGDASANAMDAGVSSDSRTGQGAGIVDGGTDAKAGRIDERTDAEAGQIDEGDAGSVACVAGDTRPCQPYPFVNATPDETTCRNGDGCSSPCKNGTQRCFVPDGGVAQWDTCEGAVGPEAADTCATGDDSNCDGVANEGCTCVDGTTETCGKALGALGACGAGMTTCTNGAWGACSVQKATSDNCGVSGDDSDCNGLANDSCPCTPGQTGTCAAKLGAKGACAAGTATCNAAGTGWTCSMTPTADTCDWGNDDNCDGIPNEGCACINGTMSTCGVALGAKGTCLGGATTCAGGAWGACSIQPSDDTCDSGNDNSCNGIPNEGCTCLACNDSNACPKNDTCVNGACVGSSANCPACNCAICGGVPTCQVVVTTSGIGGGGGCQCPR